MPARRPKSLAFITAGDVRRALHANELETMELVESVYRKHARGATVNPASLFLQFPDRPDARIIALPAALGADAAGVKWISSFPSNHEIGLPRASAVLILNDAETGYPIACIEASRISATRTAASAAVIARALVQHRHEPSTIGFIGTGLIATFVHRYLAAAGITAPKIAVYDTVAERAAAFLQRIGRPDGILGTSAEDIVRQSELVVFATTAGTPYVDDLEAFQHHPIVLHVSLRDLSPSVIQRAVNIVDDIDHCLTANTSVHLVEQARGDRDHIAGTIAQVLDGEFTPKADETVVVSPFGLGVLDIALGQRVFERTSYAAVRIDDFFYDGATEKGGAS